MDVAQRFTLTFCTNGDFYRFGAGFDGWVDVTLYGMRADGQEKKINLQNIKLNDKQDKVTLKNHISSGETSTVEIMSEIIIPTKLYIEASDIADLRKVKGSTGLIDDIWKLDKVYISNGEDKWECDFSSEYKIGSHRVIKFGWWDKGTIIPHVEIRTAKRITGKSDNENMLNVQKSLSDKFVNALNLSSVSFHNDYASPGGWILDSSPNEAKRDQLVAKFKKFISAKKSIDIYMMGGMSSKFLESLRAFISSTKIKLRIRIFMGLPPEGGLKQVIKQTTSLDAYCAQHAYNMISALFSQGAHNPKIVIPGNISLSVGAGRVHQDDVQEWSKHFGWNHSKLIVVDGSRMLTGGMNFDDMVLETVGNKKEYAETDEDIVHDLLVNIEGDAARNAQIFLNSYWESLRDVSLERHKSSLSGNIKDSIIMNSGLWPIIENIDGDFRAEFRVPTAQVAAFYPSFFLFDNDFNTFAFNKISIDGYASPDRKSSIMTVARRAGRDYGTEPSDVAILDIINSAKKTLHLSQQALFYPTYSLDNVWPDFFDALCAAIKRGVEVRILLSRRIDKNDGDDGGYTSAHSGKAFNEIYNKINNPDLFKKERRLWIANLKTEKGSFGRNHSKVIVSDMAAAYIGSQNVYPNTMTFGNNIGEAKLGEFGMISFDSAMILELMKRFFNPLWKQSIDEDNEVCNSGLEYMPKGVKFKK